MTESIDDRPVDEQTRESRRFEAIGRRAGRFAHDLNNLLGSILGHAELLAEEFPAGDPRLDDVKEIRRAGEHAAALVRQWIELGRRQTPAAESADDAAAGADRGAALAVGEAAAPDAPVRGETILMVEDDGAVRELARRALSRAGFDVLAAASAAEAEGLFDRHAGEIRLLLTDVIMPGTSGLELAHRIRSRQPDLPVLYMSGFTEDAFANRGQRDPKIPLVKKPFTPELLAARVRQMLDRS